MKLTITKDIVPEIMAQIRDLTKNETLVGIPAENADRQPEEGEEKIPLNNAEIGYLMETGRPEQNLPERPFLVPGVETVKDRIGNTMKAGAIKALKGDREATDQALNKIGLIGQSSVRNKINEGPFTPLAPRTLAERKRRGRTGEKPLIDTSQLLNSVTYVVRPKGK